MALALEGVEIVVNGRDPERVETTASAIRNKTGTSVLALVADLCSEDGREKLVAACPEPDILVTNNGGPAPGRFEDWDHAAWLAALEQNLLAPALIIRAVIGGMRARRFGRIVNITSAMVKSPHPLMGLSTAARSALTAVCKGLSREVARDNVTINNLLPERIDTDRQRLMAGLQAAARGISIEQAYAGNRRIDRGEPARNPRRVCGGVRLPVQRPSRVRIGSEPADRRWLVRRTDLNRDGRCHPHCEQLAPAVGDERGN